MPRPLWIRREELMNSGGGVKDIIQEITHGHIPFFPRATFLAKAIDRYGIRYIH